MHPMEHIVQIVQAETVIDHIQSIIECYEEPYLTLAPNFVISQLVANNGVKVILNGLGGDELFGGYHYYLYALTKWPLSTPPFPAYLADAVLGQSKSPVALNCIGKVKRSLTYITLFTTNRVRKKRALSRGFLVQDFDTPERLHQLYVGDDIKFADPIEALSYMDMMNHIGNHHVYRVDQFTMKFSIEGRLPFLDHELVEAAYKIPSQFKVFGKTQKYILRKVAQKYIHPSCLRMPKKGFRLPVEPWLRGPLKGLVEDKLHRLKQRDLWNSDTIQHAYGEFLAGRYPYQHIWHLVSVELWMESFIDKH